MSQLKCKFEHLFSSGLISLLWFNCVYEKREDHKQVASSEAPANLDLHCFQKRLYITKKIMRTLSLNIKG